MTNAFPENSVTGLFPASLIGGKGLGGVLSAMPKIGSCKQEASKPR